MHSLYTVEVFSDLLILIGAKRTVFLEFYFFFINQQTFCHVQNYKELFDWQTLQSTNSDRAIMSRSSKVVFMAAKS